MTSFYWELDRAARRILEAASLALNVTEGYKKHLFDLHSGLNNKLRLLHYPPVPTEQLRGNIVARMPVHRDWRYACSWESIAFLSSAGFFTPFCFYRCGLFVCLSGFATLTLMQNPALSQCSSKTTAAVSNSKIQPTHPLSYPLRPFQAL